MSQDIVADALNMVRNAKRAKKESVKVKIISNLLIEILKMMKHKNAIKKYKISGKDKSGEIFIGELSDCKAIKPRFSVDKTQIDKYVRRYLPARNFGTIIISTNQGLMTHEEAIEKGVGGCLVAYFY
tara:strand:- start:353 stop:733 length:381 start_codon:yes stop_codon:yes gene_type:complete